MFIDTHIHFDEYKKDITEELIDSGIKAGVEAFITVGINQKSSERACVIADKYKNVYASVGIHPHDSKDASHDDIKAIEGLVINHKVVGIGETGLDFYKNHSVKEVQEKMFIKMIEIACKSNLPLIIHSRNASKEVTEILIKEKADKIGGVFHCFSGDKIIFNTGIKLGFYFSVTGIITFMKDKFALDIIKQIPDDKLLLETDAPYLAPVPHRGKENRPEYLVETAKALAKLKNVDLKTIEGITTRNARMLFRIANSE